MQNTSKSIAKFVLLVTLILVGLSLLTVWVGSARGQALMGRVNDYAGVLTAEQRGSLERRLAEADNLPGKPQVVAVLPADMGGKTIEDYAIDVGRRWKIGRAAEDNGVLLVIAPKERKWRVEVGYGLESLIPDSRAQRIIREHMDPHLKGGKVGFYSALDASAAEVMKVISDGVGGKSVEVSAADSGTPLGIIIASVFFVAVACSIVAFIARPTPREKLATGVPPGSSPPIRRAASSTRPVRPLRAAPVAPPPRSRRRDDDSGSTAAAALGAGLGSSSSDSSSDSSRGSSSSSSDSGSSFSGGGGDFGGGGASGGD
jgi:uncharacterized protein